MCCGKLGSREEKINEKLQHQITWGVTRLVSIPVSSQDIVSLNECHNKVISATPQTHWRHLRRTLPLTDSAKEKTKETNTDQAPMIFNNTEVKSMPCRCELLCVPYNTVLVQHSRTMVRRTFPSYAMILPFYCSSHSVYNSEFLSFSCSFAPCLLTAATLRWFYPFLPPFS